MLILLGRTQDEIAAAARVDPKTLRKYYREELEIGYLNAGATLMRTAYMRANGGSGPNARWQDADPGLLKFLLTHRFDMKPPTQKIEHSGSVGRYDYSKLTDEQLAALDAILTTATVAPGSEGGASEAGS